jgi:hypothetical protein
MRCRIGSKKKRPGKRGVVYLPTIYSFSKKSIYSISEKSHYSFSKKSHAEHEIYTPPGVPRSRSFTRFTIRVGFEHFGQSVLLVVSISFLRSPVLAIFDIGRSPCSLLM